MIRLALPGIALLLRRARAAALVGFVAAGLACAPAAVEAAGPAITIGSTTPDAAAGTVTLGKVTIVYPGTDGTRITIDSVTLKGMSGTGDTLRAGEIGIAGLRTTFGAGHDTTVDIAAATLANVAAPMPSVDKLRAEGSSGSLPPFAAWLLAAKAERISIPSVEVRSKIGENSSHAVYDGVLLTGIDAGSIVEAVITTTRQTTTGSDAAALTKLTIGLSKTENIQLGPYAAWLDETLAAAAPAEKSLISTSFSLANISASGNGEAFKIDMITGTNVKLGPPTISPSELAELIKKANADPKFGETSPAESIRFLRAVFGAFEIGTLEFSGMTMSAAGKPPVGIGLIRLEGFAGTRIGELRFGDIAFVDATSGADFKLGSFALRGFDLIDIEPVLERLAQGRDPATLSPELLPKLRLAGLAMADLHVTVPGKGNFAVEGLTVDTPDWVGFSPVTVKARVVGFSMPVSAMDEPELREQFSTLGLTTLGLGSAVDVAWKEADETLAIGPITLDLADVGGIQIAATAGGVPKSVIENPQTAEQAIATLDFRGFTLKLEDGGAFPKILDLLARQQGVTRAQLAQQTAQQVQGGMIMFLGMEEEAKTLSSALGAFISDPRWLAITVGTREPIPAIAFMKVSEGDMDALSVIKKAVTIEAVANQ